MKIRIKKIPQQHNIDILNARKWKHGDGGPLIDLVNHYAEGGPENQPYTPFLNETPMQAAMRQIQSPEARAAYWNATHPQTTSETPIVAQPDGTFRRETRNIPLNTSAEAAKTALEFTPVIGDVMFAEDVVDEAKQGNYGTAAALAGLAVLPNVIEKPLKKGLKIGKRLTKNWDDRSEILAEELGKEGRDWVKVKDRTGAENTVFLNKNNNLKIAADWGLHPIQTYKDWKAGYYPMNKKEIRQYLDKEQQALDYAKQKTIELNNVQLNRRLSHQKESLKDWSTRNKNTTMPIWDNANDPYSMPRAPKDASEVADNIKIKYRDSDVSYGGDYFRPGFSSGTAAVSMPDQNIIIMPRHNQAKFSRRLLTMPTKGIASPIDTRLYTYAHEVQHQMQDNLPLLNLSRWNPKINYYEADSHFLDNIDSGDLLQPFKEKAIKNPGAWTASPNEYNADSNAYRILDAYSGRRTLFDPLDEKSAQRLNPFGLSFEQIESLWDLGYANGGNLKL